MHHHIRTCRGSAA